MPENIKKKTTDGLIWNSTERFFSKAVQFVFSVLIARILVPQHYGLIAIANLCISLSDVIVDSGFTKALLRKKEKTDTDYGTVFWFNLVVSCLIYSVLWLIAPAIGHYYGFDDLSRIIRVYTISLILNATCGIQKSHLMATLNFRRIAILELSAVLVSGIVAYVLAVQGAGVWSLVVQGIVNSGCRALFYWMIPDWKPRLICSVETLKNFFSFGSRLLVSEYLGKIYSAVCSLFIGKKYSTDTLGLYGKADAFSSSPSSIIASSLYLVTYPVIAEFQNDSGRLEKNFSSMMALSSFIVFPLMLGLVSLSNDLIPLLLTEKWNGMIPFFKVLCWAYIFITLSTIPQNFLLVRGKTRSFLHIQAISKTVGLGLLYPLSLISVNAVCIGICFCAFLTLVLLLIAVHREIHFKWGLFLRNNLTSLAMAVVMMGFINVSTLYIDSRPLSLIVGLLIGIAAYLGLSVLSNNQNLKEVMGLVKPYVKR